MNTITLAFDELKLYLRQHKLTIKKFEDKIKRPGDEYISAALLKEFDDIKFNLIMNAHDKIAYVQIKRMYDVLLKQKCE